jgi:hypothetical protein
MLIKIRIRVTFCTGDIYKKPFQSGTCILSHLKILAGKLKDFFDFKSTVAKDFFL